MMKASDHYYYLYHEENLVYARAKGHERVVLQTCKSSQEAHDTVQQIINPKNLSPAQVDAWHLSMNPEDNRPMGYLHDCFQLEISNLCKPHVQGAYRKFGKEV